MPLDKGETIENNEQKKKQVKKKASTEKQLSDAEINKFFDVEAKKKIDSRSDAEIKHEIFHLVQDLHEMEIRLSEHYEISSYEARFPNSDKRRKQVFANRSSIREKISRNLRHLLESGLDEQDIPDQMPFIPKREIKGLILNLP